MPKMLLPSTGVVDIFTIHTRLNPEEHRKVLHPDTIFVTAVRDPVPLFESAFNYFRLEQFYSATLEQFLNWPYEVGVLFKSAIIIKRNMNSFSLNFDTNTRVPKIGKMKPFSFKFDTNAIELQR